MTFGQGREARFRYSAWDGTQAVPDLDAEELLGELTDDLVYHGDLQAALRRLLQQGFDPDQGERIEGLRDLMERLRDRRREFLEQHDPSGMLDDVKERLDDVVRTEEAGIERRLASRQPRRPPRGDDTADAGEPTGSDEDEARRGLDHLEHLHQLPEDAGSRLRGLQQYDFLDDEAREKFESLQDDLRQRFMEQFSKNLTEGIRDMSDEQRQAMKDMMADLNKMLRDREAGVEPDFDEFMAKHGQFFPENPETLDELLMNMARRMAAMQQLLNSMTPEQRQELQDVMNAMMDDLDLAFEASELGGNLQNAFPQLPWEQGMDFSGDQPLDLQGGMQMMDALSGMDDLEQFMSQATSPGMLSEIDPDQVRDLLGDEAARSLEQLQRLAGELEAAGLIENKDGSFQLTARGMRRIGERALRDLFRRLERDRFAEHRETSRGALGEPTHQTRPYEFGDPFLLDVNRTIRNALLRDGAGTPVRVVPDDFEIEETERLTRTSTVLLLDLSLSMPMRDNFLAAKKVAVALQSLISSQFPRDYLGVVGFSEVAHEIEPRELTKASYDFVYGTNMQHALMLARRMLGRSPATTKQIVMITDGEPTAHIENGVPYFNYPPAPRTIEETLKEVVRCTRDRIRINTFMLDASPALRRFVERMTELNRGRAFFTTPQNLGEYVLVDFLEHRREQRHPAT